LAITSTSGPGIALKSEAIGLAVTTELPLVIIDVQRGGPSTGLPTKTEQADLLQVMFGRNGESPVPVIAASTPADCFHAAIEASRIAIKYMTPVVYLTDGYLANGAEPWRVPSVDQLPEIPVHFRTDPDGFQVYARDGETLARAWVRPGTPGLEHRIGGLEKDALTGNVSYDPENHEAMVRTRAAKIEGIARELPPIAVQGPPSGDLLVLGWGGTYGACTQAAQAARDKKLKVASAHLRWLHPFPPNLGQVLARYKKVLIPELNLGQLQMLVRARYLVDAIGLHKIQGRPFRVSEILEKIEELLAPHKMKEVLA
jgi:2-oxoglutarate ferredoxin oxidoreductase subunit alpha